MMNYSNTKKIADYYDHRAKEAEDAISAAGQWYPKEYTPDMCEEICNKIRITKKDKILEVGSGSDVLGSYVRKKCDLYVGIDISNLMLRKCAENVDGGRPNLIQAVTHALPFRERYFDITIMNSVTMYIDKKEILQKTLEEMERVTVSNGIIFIGENTTPSRTYWDYVWFQNLNPIMQEFAKPYIKLRIWLASRNIFVGKWQNRYTQVSPKFIKLFFKGRGTVSISDAACFTIRKKIFGVNPKGNRRIDFVVKLHP